MPSYNGRTRNAVIIIMIIRAYSKLEMEFVGRRSAASSMIFSQPPSQRKTTCLCVC